MLFSERGWPVLALVSALTGPDICRLPSTAAVRRCDHGISRRDD